MAQLNGGAGVEFNGGQSYLSLSQALVFNGREYSIFAVVHRKSDDIEKNYFMGMKNSRSKQKGLSLGFETDTSVSSRRPGGESDKLSAVVRGQATSPAGLLWAVVDLFGQAISYNGMGEISMIQPPIRYFDSWVIGRGGNNQQYGFNGQVAELMFFNRSLSADEIKQVEEYLNQKWFP